MINTALNMLYHVVFTEEYREVMIISNELDVLDSFRLIPGGITSGVSRLKGVFDFSPAAN